MMGTSGAANYSVSRRGDLVFVPASAAGLLAPRQRTLVWVDRNGRETPLPARHGRMRLRVFRPMVRASRLTSGSWVTTSGFGTSTRQTLSALKRGPSQDMSPIWTPDSKRVIWTSTRSGGNPNLYWQAADGSGASERLTMNSGNQFPTSTTPDGRTSPCLARVARYRHLYGQSRRSRTDAEAADRASGRIRFRTRDLARWQVDRVPLKRIGRVPGVRAALSERQGRTNADFTERRESRGVGAQRARVVLSRPGRAADCGLDSGIGHELLCRRANEDSQDQVFQGSTVLGLDLRAYDVAADGQRFLMIKDSSATAGPEALSSITIVMNWVDRTERAAATTP